MNRPEPILDLVLGVMLIVGIVAVPLVFAIVGALMLWGWLA